MMITALREAALGGARPLTASEKRFGAGQQARWLPLCLFSSHRCLPVTSTREKAGALAAVPNLWCPSWQAREGGVCRCMHVAPVQALLYYY